MSVTILHNPACGTSRSTLALLREKGIEPEIVEYLKTPPGRDELQALVARMGLTLRDILRRRGTPFEELGLDDPGITEDAILDAIAQHPILIERPIVITPKGAAICRPKEKALDLL
ncbi:arsenate reductase (glutaredoxin) [Pseudoroseomonas globiformis]|uniref:Arsenate reductase n=1 Tax=Teichococcus globiformis TaxID=2307229 RepID=A0ABV7G780_9PROT